ncbi:MAG TPA: GTPase Era [Candidatus Nitrosotenuis sp.]|jgi:GTP-binding protein Era|nr:GTPase Era [Candidatus Nitrosotenuis sp.]
MTTKCGFIAVLGAPNAGKSTLINYLVGSKVSIVSPKVQTTRQRVLGIALYEETQLIFVDTPGIFQPKRRLERAMVDAAWSASSESDLVVVVVDVNDHRLSQSHDLLAKLKDRPVILVLNKVDQIKKEHLLKVADTFKSYSQISDVFMISALTGSGVDRLIEKLVSQVSEGPWLYPEDQLTDLPQRLWAAEITREQLYLQLHHELPYETMVETEVWEEFDNGSVKISQVIYVNRDSQKSILLGKRGHQIKSLSMTARQELMHQLGRTVHLYLYVKVVENWLEKPALYRLMGLEFNV